MFMRLVLIVLAALLTARPTAQMASLVEAKQRSRTVTRRGSVRLLGVAALVGALARPKPVDAGKAGKKAAKRCQRQGGQCRAFVAEGCAQTDDPQACEKAIAPCCEHFERCNAGAGLRCISEPIGEL